MAVRQPRQKKQSAATADVNERAVKLAAPRLRSVHDLRTKLIGEGYEVGAVEKAITRLKEIHLLDDEKMAAAVGRHYKDRGNRFITQKLRSKGISPEQHAHALGELPDEVERALAAGTKKLRALAGLDAHLAARKLWQHLAGRGFSASVVQKAVRQLVRGEDWGDAE